MGTWIKRGLFICAVFAITWVMFIAYWSSANHMPDGGDVILYLLVLPVCFLLAVWAVRKVRSAMAAAAAAAVASQAAAAEAAANAAPAAPGRQPDRNWTLAIASCAIRTPHGNDATELLQQMQQHALRLELDPELTDSDGFPVLAARVPNVDAQDALDRFTAWQRQQAGDATPAALPLDDEQQRALALGADVIGELADRLTLHSALASYLDTPAHLRQQVRLPQLHVLPMLPGTWDNALRLQVASWLADMVVQQGWPGERISVVPAAGDDAHALLHLDRLVATSHDGDSQRQAPYLALVIAIASNLGSATVDQWEQQGKLLHGARNSGQTPGEAAVGLLLADPSQAAALGADDPVHLHRATFGRRDRSADLPGRVDGQLLSTLAASALADAGVAAEGVGLLATDGDHRGSRTEEIMALGYAVLPEIDLGSQCVKIGADCGAAGAATVMTALAVAHAMTAQEGAPSLVASNDDAVVRAAVVLSKPVIAPAQSEQSPQAMAAPAATA